MTEIVDWDVKDRHNVSMKSSYDCQAVILGRWLDESWE